jgi:nitroimidazol reductase NimA-like FMN-containing flavoprotein (pyridoxamine 5'-phosphate oxidase superfamily)
MRRKDREITGIDEIEAIISRADVCRIALTDNNIPYIVVMNFGYSGGDLKRLWFHCAINGRKLDMIRRNKYVCFEVDTDHCLYAGEKACDFRMGYRSVIGWGNIEIVTDDDEKRQGLDCLMSHYSDHNKYSYKKESFEGMLVLRLDIQEMTGNKCLPFSQ